MERMSLRFQKLPLPAFPKEVYSRCLLSPLVLALEIALIFFMAYLMRDLNCVINSATFLSSNMGILYCMLIAELILLAIIMAVFWVVGFHGLSSLETLSQTLIYVLVALFLCNVPAALKMQQNISEDDVRETMFKAIDNFTIGNKLSMDMEMIQYMWRCCGVSSHKDWTRHSSFNCSTSFSRFCKSVPPSCRTNQVDGKGDCFQNIFNNSVPVSNYSVTMSYGNSLTSIYGTGCIDRVEKFTSEITIRCVIYSLVFSFIGFVFIRLQKTTKKMTTCPCRKAKENPQAENYEMDIIH